MHITINVLSLTPTQVRCTRYNIMWWNLSGRWFSPGTLVSSTNKTDRFILTEITVTLTPWLKTTCCINWKQIECLLWRLFISLSILFPFVNFWLYCCEIFYGRSCLYLYLWCLWLMVACINVLFFSLYFYDWATRYNKIRDILG